MEGTNPATIVTTAFADFAGYIPAVATAAIGVTVLIWGIKKLSRFFKGLAS
ncbi:MAG: hypothetical protein ACTH93_05225 [Pseudoclavibacter sp.]